MYPSPLFSPKTFSSPQEGTCTHNSHSPHFSFPSVPGNHKLLSVSKDVPLLDVSYKWNQVARGLWCLLLLLSMFPRLTCVATRVRASLLRVAQYYFTVRLHRVSFMFFCWWICELFPPFEDCQECCSEHLCTSVWVPGVISFRFIFLWVELLSHMVILYLSEEPPNCFPQWLSHFTFLLTLNSKTGK